MPEKLLYDQDGHVVTITFNMPETRNALTDMDLCAAIVEAMHRIDRDQSVRCAIVTGAGKAFSSGGNLKHMKEKSSIFGGDTVAVKDGYRTGIQQVARAMWECEVPLIAAVNGPSYGAGCDTTCLCDIRIASTTASFAENFVRVGLISGDGGAWLLPRQIGLSRAAEMTFTAEPVDAATALEWGLVSKVVEPDQLLPEAAGAGRQDRQEPAAPPAHGQAPAARGPEHPLRFAPAAGGRLPGRLPPDAGPRRGRRLAAREARGGVYRALRRARPERCPMRANKFPDRFLRHDVPCSRFRRFDMLDVSGTCRPAASGPRFSAR
jgi:enoyl-CoA hydratase/carnithine racemase